MISELPRLCKPGANTRASGVRAGAEASIEDPQLPGVLPDLAGLGELTFARGNFSVVTEPTGSSRIRASIEGAGSLEDTFGSRLIRREDVEWEKKSGEVGPSGCAEPALKVVAGISLIRGGDAPVRGFLRGDGSMMESEAACFDDVRFELFKL